MAVSRALEFVLALIRSIHDADDHTSMAHLAKHAYDTTLAKYHPWLVRKGVHLAMWALPTRKQVPNLVFLYTFKVFIHIRNK